MRRVETSWKLVEEVLWEHTHSVYKALRRPAADERVAALEAALGLRLPADYRRSLSIHDGLSEAGQPSLVNGMALLSAAATKREWKMRCQVHGTDDPGGCPLTTDKRIRNDRWWRPGWVPFMATDGEMLLIDLDPAPAGKTGQVWRFYNSSSRPREVIAETFAKWLSALTDALVARQFRLSEYGDIWLDDLGLTIT